MRQVALIIIMAQMGCYVPATKVSLPIFDQIFARIGAMDDLISGQSTFMVEMTETNQAIANATSNSLLLFDEIGRGTATYDGMALAEAVIEYVHDRVGAKTLFSTHYHELTALEERLTGLQNVHVGAVEEDGDLVFLYQVSPGSADKSYGIQAAKLAGLPETLLTRAANILEKLEQTNKEAGIVSEIPRKEIVEDLPKQNTASDQLSLFNQNWSPVEEEVLNKIKQTDVMNLTPLDALKLLNDIQNELHSKNN